jgi:hypothetical protein
MSRLTVCPCGRRWKRGDPTSTERTCRPCRNAIARGDGPKLRLPTMREWRQLATDDEVRAGHADWVRGVRNPLTAAMRDEHGKRAL